ncbi:MAG: hypothetical protein FWF97_02830 [Alphaproteobacteria bacterium]|nr:hypothetical protein [Alphaproteobacteria bacterium]
MSGEASPVRKVQKTNANQVRVSFGKTYMGFSIFEVFTTKDGEILTRIPVKSCFVNNTDKTKPSYGKFSKNYVGKEQMIKDIRAAAEKDSKQVAEVKALNDKTLKPGDRVDLDKIFFMPICDEKYEGSINGLDVFSFQKEPGNVYCAESDEGKKLYICMHNGRFAPSQNYSGTPMQAIAEFLRDDKKNDALLRKFVPEYAVNPFMLAPKKKQK